MQVKGSTSELLSFSALNLCTRSLKAVGSGKGALKQLDMRNEKSYLFLCEMSLLFISLPLYSCLLWFMILLPFQNQLVLKVGENRE